MTHERRRGRVRAYNQARRTLSLLSPALIAVGVLGLFGAGETRSNGAPIAGWERHAVSLVFVAVGVAFGWARLIVFRQRRESE
jgi:hypothetical protein